MRVVVPFGVTNPKTRLGGLLSPAERRSFARAMLDDVLDALHDAGHSPELLASAPVDVDVPTTVDDRPLDAVVNSSLDASIPVAVVMADLPLVTPDALSRLFSTTGDVVIAPGRGGGTNALVVRHPEFRVDYHGVSYLDHVERARAVGAHVGTVDSFRLATDVDERADLVEVLVHGDGAARSWLERTGVRLDVNAEDRVAITRVKAVNEG